MSASCLISRSQASIVVITAKIQRKILLAVKAGGVSTN